MRAGLFLILQWCLLCWIRSSLIQPELASPERGIVCRVCVCLCVCVCVGVYVFVFYVCRCLRCWIEPAVLMKEASSGGVGGGGGIIVRCALVLV